MPSKTEFLAREICRKAGYDPDQVVAEIDVSSHFDYLAIGLVPVDIKKLKPLYVKFLNEAKKFIAEKGSSSTEIPAYYGWQRSKSS